LFTNPRPSQNEIGHFYESKDYISHTNEKKGWFNMAYQAIRSYAIKNKIALIKRISGLDQPVLLDIGCGTGEFLSACKKSGWQVAGVEPGEKARKMAIENHQLEISDEAFLNTTDLRFDVITMWHVLEHVHDLNGRLDQVHTLLKQNGKLIIAVPNPTAADAKMYGPMWAAWDVPRHLYHFKPAVMKRLMSNHGFRHVSSYPMKFDAYYVSLLSTGYQHGKKSVIGGMISGLKSNFNAKGNPENYSSVIYVFEKNV
jgi:2-polyprenyl-3-methyl-5-hydroxy-6-metoxy-1,4-benzoquinol methylase